MERITPQQILDAYQVTGLKPVAKSFLTQIDGVNCGCALTAYACATGASYADLCQANETESVDRFILRQLNMDEEYLWGFVSGFDGGTETFHWMRDGQQIENRQVGFRDGIEARKLVDEIIGVEVIKSDDTEDEEDE